MPTEEPVLPILLSNLEILAEGISITLAAEIIYLLIRISSLLNETIRRPLTYFTIGFALSAVAVLWELLVRHFSYFVEGLPQNLHYFLFALGFSFICIATYRVSLLVLPRQELPKF